ncbi:membrane-bound lytic murein transglycosylase MltF [Aliamphritea spongicola]|uniref:membrane-bound lytic murein transglycosylase MltF n=1 Tax=Aliamphritea spongicola TaxID=707589 RepID=UPI00196AFB08|nr:membrane-bound lytic murein transglycosylase MltF [Aliamphritea spongicola]MBN3564508.1 membrane-bound lytic murein transglycosylase MltF [Aliamphritea spongicola]
MRTRIFFLREVFFITTILAVIGWLFLANLTTDNQLEAIQKTGVLKIVTRNTPTTYISDKDGKPAGFEYDLAKAFADEIGVEIELVIPDSFGDIFPVIKNHKAHIAAAGLTITESREAEFSFAQPYAYSTPTLIYRVTQGQKKPISLKDLEGKSIEVLADSSHSEIMQKLKAEFPGITWQENSTGNITELLDDVYNKKYRYTISDDIVFNAQKSFFPGLKTAFSMGKSEPIAWMVAKQNDQSLLNALETFFSKPETKQLVTELQDKYFNRENTLTYVDIETFKRDMRTRFCKLEQYFYMAEQETDIDWLLLAAIAYQESHWNPKAVSPTGVKGIMMLTNAAAKEVGVEDRTDPIQSVLGGAEYLTRVMKKIPERIQGDDRIWFALAAYNVGYGHLEDARILTSRAGKNPDLWEDVKQFLPLLTQPKYYKTVKRGYARGYEPVIYVKNIRQYYDLILWQQQLAEIEASKPEPTPAENEGEIVMPGNPEDSDPNLDITPPSAQANPPESGIEAQVLPIAKPAIELHKSE